MTVSALVVVLLAAVPVAGAADDLVLSPELSASTSETVYNSSGYTTEPGEITDCPPGTTGARTGWTRFAASVSGTLNVTVVSSYDAILHVYIAPTASPPDVASLQDAGCTDADHAAAGGAEARSIALAAGQSAYVQTLGVCPAPCRAPGAQTAAGATTVRLAFAASNIDGDAVPDTLDACPTAAGGQADGCPAPPPADRDRDGVPDRTDACAAVAGNLADGCPGPLGGTIRGRWQVNALLTKLVSLVVEAPIGSRINLRCSSPRRVCPFDRRVIARTKRRITNLTRHFGSRRILPSNVSIVVRVTHARRIGIYQRLVTRRDQRLPKVTRACIYPGAKIRPCR